MNKPILNPSVPYIDHVQGGKFKPQSLVKIQGTTPGFADRFNINLQCGPTTTPQDDIAIQISARVLDGLILVNSLQDGIWGEERVNPKLSIKRSERFEITIFCDINLYKVAINGSYCCEFPQTIRYDRITHLGIDGDVVITQISYETVSQASTPSASSLRPNAPAANEIENFEMVANNVPQTGYQPQQPGFQPLPPGIHPASSAGFRGPPTYEETLRGNNFQPFPITAAPYPGAPNPNNGTPYPISSGYPTPGSSYYSPPDPHVTNHFHSASPIPLNASGSQFQPVKRKYSRKIICTIFICFCAAFLIITIVLGVVL